MQLFAVFLLIHHAKKNNKGLFIGFLDYEKAFDYANRSEIILKLIEKDCGRRFTDAIAKMFSSTTYVPSLKNKLCNPISTSYGVAQGRNSSPNIYSFFVSEMPSCLEVLDDIDFMDPYSLLQLADDTTVLAESADSLQRKMHYLLEYSKEIFQIPNISKTVFCHFSDAPVLNPLQIDENTQLSSVDMVKGHWYLGVKFFPTNDTTKLILSNLNERASSWCRFYSWLEINEETPIEIKILVLDNCLFNSLLYAVEVWGDISCIEKNIRTAEQKALRSILKVKKGTSTDLIYNELKRPDIISKIKDRQYKFFNKISTLNHSDALVKSILDICWDTPFVQYYQSLTSNNKERNIIDRERRIQESSASMICYYSTIVDVQTKSNIYTNYIVDSKRSIITRWRLSNHNLFIETGRYKTPYVDRSDRRCFQCDVLEDETHAIYICPAFEFIRRKYAPLLEKYGNVKLLLNPAICDIYEVSNLLSEIDNILNKR